MRKRLFRQPNGPLLDDLFSGPNGIDLATHAPKVGAGWLLNGTWDIQSNRANTTGSAPADPAFIATMRTPRTAVQVSAVVNTAASAGVSGVCFWYYDLNNFWLAAIQRSSNKLFLFERIAGSYNIRAQPVIGGGIAATDHVIVVDASKAGVTVSLDGTQQISYTPTVTGSRLFGNRYGFRSDTAGDRFTSFRVIAAAPPTLKNLVFEGDSLTAGTGSSGGNTYPAQCITSLGASLWTYNNNGVAGQTLQAMLSNASTEVDLLSDTGAPANICVIWAGTNDVVGGRTSAQILADLLSYIAGLRAAGFRVVVVTMLARTEFVSTPAEEAVRQEVNTAMLGGGYGDAVANLSSDSRLDDGTSTLPAGVDSGDHVHLSNTGYGYVASAVATAIGTL